MLRRYGIYNLVKFWKIYLNNKNKPKKNICKEKVLEKVESMQILKNKNDEYLNCYFK